MGIAYRSDDAIGLSVSVWDGEITDDQRRRQMEAVASDPNWGAGGLLLTDLTGVSTAQRASATQVLEAAAEFSERLAGQVRNAKWAIVASETFVLAQRFGSYLEEEVRRIIVFNDLDAACAWLGVDSADARAIIGELRADLRSAETAARKPPN
jgi:hypothetical protein